MDRFNGGFVHTGTDSAHSEENWASILESDPNIPFDVNDLYPAVIIPSYTCPKCMRSVKTPICVKNGPHTSLYCPHCKSYIKHASKKELKFL